MLRFTFDEAFDPLGHTVGRDSGWQTSQLRQSVSATHLTPACARLPHEYVPSIGGRYGSAVDWLGQRDNQPRLWVVAGSDCRGNCYRIGIGGRDIAAQQLAKWTSSIEYAKESSD